MLFAFLSRLLNNEPFPSSVKFLSISHDKTLKPVFEIFTIAQYIYLTCWYVPAATEVHVPVLQSSKSAELPGQSNPPLAGLGLVQNRERDLLPPPQVFVQDPHVAQAPQLPSTAKKFFCILQHKISYIISLISFCSIKTVMMLFTWTFFFLYLIV